MGGNVDRESLRLPASRTVRLGIAIAIIKRRPECELFLELKRPLQLFNFFCCTPILPSQVQDFRFESENFSIQFDVTEFLNELRNILYILHDAHLHLTS